MIKVLINELPKRFGGIPLLYYCGYPNFGDLLGYHIFQSLSEKPVFRPVRQKSPHVIFLGSLLSQANENSLVAGAGFIDRNQKAKVDRVYFVRGPMSRTMLDYQWCPPSGIAIGDAVQVLGNASALNRIQKIYASSIVPDSIHNKRDLLVLHHTTFESLYGFRTKFFNLDNITIASTALDTGILFKLVQSADVVASDALHPLILSDTLKVPNLWVNVTGHTALIGGDFKFNDYAAQIPSKVMKKFTISHEDITNSLRAVLHNADVRHYTGDPTELYKLTQSAIEFISRKQI